MEKTPFGFFRVGSFFQHSVVGSKISSDVVFFKTNIFGTSYVVSASDENFIVQQGCKILCIVFILIILNLAGWEIPIGNSFKKHDFFVLRPGVAYI